MPAWKIFKHQPVPDFSVVSGQWDWWDRRGEQDQSLTFPFNLSGSQPFACNGDGAIKTTEQNIGAMLLMLIPQTAFYVPAGDSTVTLKFGQRYAAKVTYVRAGYDWNGVPDFVTRRWKLELEVDGVAVKSAAMHHTTNQLCVTFAAGIDRTDLNSQRFYVWLANAGNALSYVEPDIRRFDQNCHFGSGNLFLDEGFDDAAQMNQPTEIAVTGAAAFRPVYYLKDGFQNRGSLSPVSLASRISAAGSTHYSVRQPAMNFLHPVWRAQGFSYSFNVAGGPVLDIDNGGQGETVAIPYSSSGNYFPNNYLGFSGYNRYQDAPIYAHCIANYKHSLSALVPDSDGPPLHHESAVRTRLKQLRITPNFSVIEAPTGLPLQSTSYQAHSPLIIGLETGCLGDWSGSAVLGNGSSIYYLISLRRAEAFRDITVSTFSNAVLQEATTLQFLYHITPKQGYTVSLSVSQSAPTPTVGTISTNTQSSQLDATQQGELFSGGALHIGSGSWSSTGSGYSFVGSGRAPFSLEAVGT